MSRDSIKFYGNNLIREQRDGIAVVGFFVKLSNGETHMPNKGDHFKKFENGSIIVKSLYRNY